MTDLEDTVVAVVFFMLTVGWAFATPYFAIMDQVVGGLILSVIALQALMLNVYFMVKKDNLEKMLESKEEDDSDA